ncbi:MAG: SAM-dependent methyltransferase [Pirellulaceae bacterium]
MTANPYLFVVCQRGAEHALKNEIARRWPDFRFSYSRPGFVTFRLPEDAERSADFDLRSTFARAYGFSLGRVVGQRADVLASELWSAVKDRRVDHLHVWQRDMRLPGDRGFEPGISLLASEAANILVDRRPIRTDAMPHVPVNRRARVGQAILDCVIVEPNEWWLGHHVAGSMPSRYPGGVCVIDPQADTVSRAFWKMTEALNWSQLPVEKGDRCVEMGSAPGGSCQALLARGLRVIGVDPADMDESILEHPNFTHLPMRAADVKRREWSGVRWLSVDTNVAPNHTLDTVESLVADSRVHIRGMLLTLKFPDWQVAEQIPAFLDRIRSWGYRYVRARQLAFHRHEICVAAMRVRSMRRRPPWKQRLKG